HEQDEQGRDEIPDGEVLLLGVHRSVPRPRRRRWRRRNEGAPARRLRGGARNLVAFGIHALLVRVVVLALRFVARGRAPAGAYPRTRQQAPRPPAPRPPRGG